MKLPEKLTRAAGKCWLTVKRKSPEILFACGTVSFGMALYSVVKASSKADQLIADHEGRLEEAKCEYVLPENLEYEATNVDEAGVEFQVKGEMAQKTEKEINRDVRKCYMTTAKEFVKLYSVTAGFSVVSLVCFGGAYKVLSGRVAAGLATISGLENYIALYEKRNIELNGEQSHEMCKYGYKEIEEKHKDPKTGKMITEKKLVPDYPTEGEEADDAVLEDFMNRPLGRSVIIFSKETSNEYKGTAGLDRLTLEAAEADAIRMWRTRGWVCENDVREYIGMRKTIEGQFIGKYYREGADHGEEPSLGITKHINEAALTGHNNKVWILETNFTDNLLTIHAKEKEKKAEFEKQLRLKRLSEEV